MGSTEALRVIRDRAAADRKDAQERWATPATGGARSLEQAAGLVRSAGRLTLNFHPDRIARNGRTVSFGLAASGAYRSQWVTGISAGSRSALRGGERQRFESELFLGAYDRVHPSSGQHPVYGSFDLLCDDHGGSPRFGSSYVVLTLPVRERTTLCLGDSNVGPADVGTFDEPRSVLAGLAEQAFGGRLLNRDLDVDVLMAALDGDYRLGRASRDLDGYIEAQVHGGVSLVDDVESIVLDPSFRGTDVERDITAAAERFGFEVSWHCGSELAVEDVPHAFRGPTMPPLARAVASSTGIVHARAIGSAAAQVRHGEPSPSGDPPGSPLQQLKYLWHTVLAHGRSATKD